MRKELHVAALQMKMGYNIRQNTEKVLGAIDRAARCGADILLTPELCITHNLDSAPPLDVHLLNWARKSIVNHAKERRIGLILGTPDIRKGCLYNSAHIYDRKGKFIGYYDKTHLVGAPKGEAINHCPGDRLPVFNFEGVKIGILICFDITFPENIRILCLKGARILFCPLNCSGGTYTPAKRRAEDGAAFGMARFNEIHTVIANTGNGRQHVSTAIYDSGGLPVAVAPVDGDQFIHGVLDLTQNAKRRGTIIYRRCDLWSQPENRRLLLSTPRRIAGFLKRIKKSGHRSAALIKAKESGKL